jgi:formylglycine-generating enzyme required for sulfatase activity
MTWNRSNFSPNGILKKIVAGFDTSSFPVENVSWYDAIEFCNRLSESDELSPCIRLANVKRGENGSIESADVTAVAGTGYRLLTEAEWEYSCRAGTATRFNFGSDISFREANVSDIFGGVSETTKPKLGPTKVGTYHANAMGLYDMHGNVCEWCLDMYLEDHESLGETDPINVTNGTQRICRGGSWLGTPPLDARSAARTSFVPTFRNGFIGFRMARRP